VTEFGSTPNLTTLFFRIIYKEKRMNTDTAFFESLCYLSNLAIISKINSEKEKKQAMNEVARLIAIYLNVIVMSEDADESLSPETIINFIKEQYKK